MRSMDKGRKTVTRTEGICDKIGYIKLPLWNGTVRERSYC